MEEERQYAHLGIQIRTSGRAPDRDQPLLWLQS